MHKPELTGVSGLRTDYGAAQALCPQPILGLNLKSSHARVIVRD